MTTEAPTMLQAAMKVHRSQSRSWKLRCAGADLVVARNPFLKLLAGTLIRVCLLCVRVPLAHVIVIRVVPVGREEERVGGFVDEDRLREVTRHEEARPPM